MKLETGLSLHDAKEITVHKEKNTMPSRKELKRAGRHALRRNYVVFVMVCLIASFIGTKNTYTLSVFGLSSGSGDSQDSGRFASDMGLDRVWEDIASGDLKRGEEDSRSALSHMTANAQNPYLGRTRGVFAQVVNSIMSGSILVTLANAVTSAVKSPDIATSLLVGLSLLLALLLWLFIVRVYNVISARFFLEGRLYDRLPIGRFLFLLRVKKWMHVAWVMLFQSILLILWSVTIIGAFIKLYSYALVPYIVAENPAVPARRAITLSRKMMRGHKWELFILELSFIGWDFLSMLTFSGPLGVFFLNPYREATIAEYYAHLRALAKANQVPDSDLLNDVFLYERPSGELLRRAYTDELSLLKRPLPETLQKSGLEGWFTRLFGVTWTYKGTEDSYNEYLEQKAALDSLEHILNGTEYPFRLNPIPEPKKRRRVEHLHYMRHYSLLSLIAMFFLFSFIGWVWEVSLHLITDGEFVNRGVMFGPWLPIYGSGALMILVLLNKFRGKPAVEFITAVVLCGCLEYATAWYLEFTHDGMKWWDYSGYFLNLHGRICAEGLLVFGVGGLAIVYLIAPLMDTLLRRVPIRCLAVVCALLVCAFTADQFYSARHPNTGDGITDYGARAGTEFLQPIMSQYAVSDIPENSWKRGVKWQQYI